MSNLSSKITIDKLKRLILELSTQQKISVDMSLKFLDYIAKNSLLPNDANKILISLTTLSLTKEEIEKMLNFYMTRKITNISREEDSDPSFKKDIIEKPTLEHIDEILSLEKEDKKFDYRDHVYNYLFTHIHAIDKDNVPYHYGKIKSTIPQITEIEFKKILSRVIDDNKQMNLPYEGKTEELQQTLDFISLVESDELYAFTSNYVHLIKDPSLYIMDNLKNLTLNKLLTLEDEKYYGKMLTSSNPLKRAEAKQKFTLSNLKLIMYVARQFARNQEDLISLFDEGFLGLQKAISKFDYKKNFRFSTYAIWWIKRAILNYLQNVAKTIRIPIHLVSLLTKLVKLERNLKKKENTITISKATLAQEAEKILGIKEKQFNYLYPFLKDHVKFEEFNQDTIDQIEITNKQLIDSSYINEVEEEELSKTLNRLLKQLLTEKEYQIIIRRYGLDKTLGKQTLQAIGNTFSLSKERVRQIELSAHRKLESNYVQSILKSYFDLMK